MGATQIPRRNTTITKAFSDQRKTAVIPRGYAGFWPPLLALVETSQGCDNYPKNMAHEITQRRWNSQEIAGARGLTAAEVVRTLGAIQAQDYANALWAVGLRSPGSTRITVEQAIADATIVRTWPLRGTLHFVAAADLRWMLALLAPRIIAGSVGRQRLLGLDDNGLTFGKSAEALVQALQGGKTLVRAEVLAALEQAGITTVSQRGYHLLWRAALEGVICLGPLQDKQQTFVLLDEWIPPARSLTREESLAELTQRYFTGHGPATQQDFMWWSALPAADVKRGLELSKSTLIKETSDGKTYWLGPQAAPARVPGLHLLPGFDEYLLGYKDRGAILAAEHSTKVCPGGNGVFAPMLVSAGQIIGTWKRTVKKTTVTIELQPFAPLSATARDSLGPAVSHFGSFWGLTALLV